MPRETKAATSARLQKIIVGLRKAYPEAHCELDHTNPLELLVATILSAQCTDKRVNLVTADLFKKYSSAADYAQAPLAELERAIKSTGFFRNKAKSIKSCCQAIVEKHEGRVPRTMEELTQLGGVPARPPMSCWATRLTSTAAWWLIRMSPGWRSDSA